METERSSKRIRVEDEVKEDSTEEIHDTPSEDERSRRSIRSQYREIEVRINEGKDEIANSEKFMSIMNEVENMHQHVNKPREQLADSGALFALASTLVASVKTHIRGGITPAQFVSCLIREFGNHQGLLKGSPSINWKSIGSFASPLFMNAPGCRTMIGPTSNELKHRKLPATRKSQTRKRSILMNAHPYPGEVNARPEKVEKAVELVSNTDKSIQIIFEKLKKEKKSKFDNLILNRSSFAKTIENVFALSFLVKDGRVRIYIDESGSEVVAPCNGPSAEEIKARTVKTHQFVFRYNFDDWKLMKNLIPEGEELMMMDEIPEAIPIDSKLFNPAPIKKFLRSYGGVTIAKF